jgi:hypothetical protein
VFGEGNNQGHKKNRISHAAHLLCSATIIPLINMVAKERRFLLNDQKPVHAESIFLALTDCFPLPKVYGK